MELLLNISFHLPLSKMAISFHTASSGAVFVYAKCLILAVPSVLMQINGSLFTVLQQTVVKFD